MYDKITAWLIAVSIMGLLVMGFGFFIDLVFNITNDVWKGIKWAVKKMQMYLYFRKKAR